MTLTVPGDTRDGSLQGVLATLQSANSPQEIHLRPTTAIDDRSPRLGVCAGQQPGAVFEAHPGARRFVESSRQRHFPSLESLARHLQDTPARIIVAVPIDTRAKRPRLALA